MTHPPSPPRRGRLSHSPACTRPPEGWWCSRTPGHDGPCAARPLGYPSPTGLWGRLRARIGPDAPVWRHPDGSEWRPWTFAYRVRAGYLIPRGYGVAWVSWTEDSAVCLPIPLNLLAGAARAAWLWLRRGGCAIPSIRSEAYSAGRRDERQLWRSFLDDSTL